MKPALKKLLIGGATLVTLGTAPVIPEDMELLYSFQCPCVENTSGSTPADLVKPLVVSNQNDAYSVFVDRKGNQVLTRIEPVKYERMGEVVGIEENPTKNEYLTAFEAFVEPKPVEAAIAYDSALYTQTAAASSLTFSFTNTAGNVLYVFGHDAPNVSTVVTGVTYAAAALTKINELPGVGGGVANDRAITAWRKNSPATGANNVVVTASSGNNLRFHAVSYSGADTTTSENGTDTSVGDSVATISTDITPTFTGCWMAEFGKDGNGNRTYTNTTGDTIRYNTDAGGHHYTDTASTITASVQNTITHTMTATDLGVLAWTICPTQGGSTPVKRQSEFFME